MWLHLSVMAKKYTGFDKAATGKKEAVERFIVLMKRRWGFQNLGSWNVRLMRSAPKGMKIGDPGAEKFMSVHATARAVDLGFSYDRQGIEAARQAIAWLTSPEVVAALDIEEVHDYSAVSNPNHPTAKKWGRGWRIGRGWKEWTADDNGGTPMGRWIHAELGPDSSDLPADELEKRFRSLPKPA